MSETDISELNLALVKLKLLGVWAFNNFRFLREHVEEVLYVDLRLCNLPEQRAHVKEWPSELHKVGLDQDEVSRGHHASHDVICCHKQVQSQTS